MVKKKSKKRLKEERLREKSKIRICSDCGNDYHEYDMIHGPHPYMAEIEEDYTKVWLCKDCYNDICNDI